MGYTNYAYHKQYSVAADAHKAFNRLVEFAPALFAEAEAQGIKLGNGHGDEDSEPIITPREIFFNGRGEHNSYETCCAELSEMLSSNPSRGGTPGFTFCKTARRPYDPVVVAFYIQGTKLGVFKEWSSDGSDEPCMMMAGKALLTSALIRLKDSKKPTSRLDSWKQAVADGQTEKGYKVWLREQTIK